MLVILSARHAHSFRPPCGCGLVPLGRVRGPTVEERTAGGPGEKPTAGGPGEKPAVGGPGEKPAAGGPSEQLAVPAACARRRRTLPGDTNSPTSSRTWTSACTRVLPEALSCVSLLAATSRLQLLRDAVAAHVEAVRSLELAARMAVEDIRMVAGKPASPRRREPSCIASCIVCVVAVVAAAVFA